MINYSIIIPHKNNLVKLLAALKSIPVRKDIEVIIVDNSESRITYQKIQDNKQHDLKLLFSDKNKGAGHARNIGLNIAIGKWILFLDSDDNFEKKAFFVFDQYKDSEYDLIYFKSNSGFENSNKKSNRHIFYSKLVSDFLQNKKNSLDNLKYKYSPPWGKLIRHELIKEYNLRFDEVPASNDVMFSAKLGHFAKKIAADKSEVYYITETNNSLTKTITSINSRSRFIVAIEYYKYMVTLNKTSFRPYLFSQVIKSTRFGFNELMWYVSYSLKKRVNIFLGLKRLPYILCKLIYKKSIVIFKS